MNLFPFPGGLDNSENGMLLFALLAAAYYLLRPADASGWRWAILKTIPVAFMAIVARDLGGPVWLAAALGLSALGDLLLAFKGEKAFLGGLGAFLLAHLAYIALFIGAAGDGPYAVPSEPWRMAAALIVLVHAATMARRLLPAVGKDLRLPVLAYVLAITAMGVAGAFHATPQVFAGVALFIISDTLLATERFLTSPESPHKAWLGKGVWTSYVAAQLLILTGVIA